MEYSPGKWVKFICLEGNGKLKLNNKEEEMDFGPGQMIVMHPNAARFPLPVIVNIKKMLQTSALTDEETFGSLSREAKEAIENIIASQLGAKREGALLPGYLHEHGQMPSGDKNGGGQSKLTGTIPQGDHGTNPM
jgi:hypothetical protein